MEALSLVGNRDTFALEQPFFHRPASTRVIPPGTGRGAHHAMTGYEKGKGIARHALTHCLGSLRKSRIPRDLSVRSYLSNRNHLADCPHTPVEGTRGGSQGDIPEIGKIRVGFQGIQVSLEMIQPPGNRIMNFVGPGVSLIQYPTGLDHVSRGPLH